MSDQLSQQIRDLLTTGYAPSRQQAEEERNTQAPEWATPWVLRSRLRALIDANDPRRQLLVSRQVNHEELSATDLSFVFGPDPRVTVPQQEGQAK